MHNYVLAVMNRGLSRKPTATWRTLKDKPTFEEFRQAFAVGRLTPGQEGIKIGGADITGDTASVEVIMVYTPGDPFSSGSDNVGSAQLLLPGRRLEDLVHARPTTCGTSAGTRNSPSRPALAASSRHVADAGHGAAAHPGSPEAPMKTVRRLYFYAVALISIEVVLWGLINLLRSIREPDGGGHRARCWLGPWR